MVQESSVEVLKRRFVSGEITLAEFREMLATLEPHAVPAVTAPGGGPAVPAREADLESATETTPAGQEAESVFRTNAVLLLLLILMIAIAAVTILDRLLAG